MDGSLLKPRRPLRSLAAQVPFYQPPSCLAKTSAQIISEARVAMTTGQHSVAMATSQHPVNTKRPFTPRDAGRVLFGAGRMRRPPSAVSIRQVHFHDVDSTVLPKLVDLDQTKNNANNQNGAGALTLSGVALLKTQNGRWRLPAIPQKIAHSQLEKLPEEQTTPKKPLQPKSPETKPEAPPILDSTTTNQRPPKEDSFMRMRRLTQQKVVGMDQLMAWSEIADLADEDNRINEARAADVTKQQLNQSADVSNHQLLQSAEVTNHQLPQSADVKQSVDVRNQLQDSADVANQMLQSADESVEAALERIALLQGSNCDADLSRALDQLYSAVEREGDKIIRNHRAKAVILKALHPFIEVSSEPLLLRLARVILALRVTGQNLSAICKIVFKVSRSDKHDDYFLENNILALFVESLGRASPLEDAEACIYGYGALKFLTMNSALSSALLDLGLLQLIVLHMKIVNNSRLELSPIAEPTSHALFQLTGALRNLASDSTQYAALLQTGAITQLCRSLQLFSADLDLVCNISRTLSIISTNDGCCKEIVDCEDGFKTMTKILRKFPGRQDVVVRLGYAMGNAVAKSNSARIKLYQEPEALKVILDLMESYLEKDLQESMSEDINGDNTNLQQQIGSDGSVEDVLIKMIRIIANMSLHPDVGVGLACAFDADEMDSESGFVYHTQNKKDAERLISMLLKVLRRKSATESEELVISALSTLNNLSYYAASSSSTDSPFAIRNIELAEALGHLLTTDNEECLTEVARVLGNLTRSRQVRDFLLETGGVSSLIRCLLRENVELLSATAGVLVNLMADWDKRLALKEDNGISRLIWVLGRWGVGDWRLANLICQVLWNFCIDSTDLCAAFGIRPINLLLATLIELLDEERLFGVTEDGDADEAVLCSGEYRQWEQFALVATNLLEKIELCLQPQTTDAVMTSSMSGDGIGDVIHV